jgi:hypothetical protein
MDPMEMRYCTSNKIGISRESIISHLWEVLALHPEDAVILSGLDHLQDGILPGALALQYNVARR